MQNDILEYLENETSFINLDDISSIFTANDIAKKFSIKRNTASHYLNELNKSGILIKIESRPVYYFDKKVFESQNFTLDKTTYKSVDSLKNEKPMVLNKNNLFSMLIGHDKSLKPVIDQVESALYYPDNGLPVIFTGESGTGKTYMVHLIYQYCLNNGLIDDDAPFITVNCAQYANNPELLTSNLFGYVKGAFTGATEDKKGAFESADRGILFLDEVHRLNSEGQEKLFTFLDQGIIYRVGDTNNPIKLKVRLFFATTESLSSDFLTTFVRRIPIQISLPSLNERSRDERLELIYSFFLNEQRKIKKEITVTGQVLNLLLNQSYKGNIGELKSNIKVTTARAISKQIKETTIHIDIYSLPKKVLMNAGNTSELSKQDSIHLTNDTKLEDLLTEQRPQQERIIKSYERIIRIFQRNNQSLKNTITEIKEEVETLFEFLMFETNFKENHEPLTYLTKYTRNILNQMESSYQIHFNGNSVYAISYYIFQRINCNWIVEDIELKKIITNLEEQVKNAFPNSFNYVKRILQLCKPKMDIDIQPMDIIILTLHLSKNEWNKKEGIPKAIIVAHGYATASSIADVVNTFLKKDLFESFDMPINISPREIADEILDYSKKNDISNGLIILADMGSLKDIYQYFPNQIKAPIVIINNVTTPLAIAVGEQIQKKISLKNQIEQSLKQTKMDYKIIYPDVHKDKVIVTTCLTGIGTATKISSLIERSLPSSISLKVLPYDFAALKDKGQVKTLSSMYDCLGIIGTDNPMIKKLPYISLENLISGEGINTLCSWVSSYFSQKDLIEFNDNIIRNFSLEKVMDVVTILDTDKVVKEVDVFLKRIQEIGDYHLTNAKKLAIYIHVSCLIERLVRNSPIKHYEGYSELEKCQKDKLNKIKLAFSVIENDYSVKVPKPEVAYVYDLIFRKTDNSTKDEDF
jgi:sigma-54 dependent transcriptional regulator of gfr operon